MPVEPSGVDPFWMWRWPLSGDVNQRITAPWFSPSITVKYAGDAVIEDRVVTEVASYGKQLGWLSELVIAMANKQPVPAETLQRLKEATDKIDAIKAEVRPSALEAAEAALDQLEKSAPEDYRRLLDDRHADRRQRAGSLLKRPSKT